MAEESGLGQIDPLVPLLSISHLHSASTPPAMASTRSIPTAQLNDGKTIPIVSFQTPESPGTELRMI